MTKSTVGLLAHNTCQTKPVRVTGANHYSVTNQDIHGNEDMKLFYKDLAAKKIDKLIINSLDQALYQAIVIINGAEHIVWKDEKTTLLTRNLTEMREHFEQFDINEIVLRHESAYDEMIGSEPKKNSNRLEIPLGKNPYALPKHLH
ncbi:DUF6482 family protein [Pseudoalteromonas sp. DL2-H2.2]|uniref:DUF6482 family protein n=1 Tax=Pseudoalteromonas sp. DL2-H2.2 TaxID=2908889 RepID=UPI001F35AF3B|nr:DUF6482 family protein [Pseudoalteromonas sp. DL2-H2.2]MCF2908500.1 DUF6482 family protein [Pseudoalteromonas sp. DL2-H2.2]